MGTKEEKESLDFDWIKVNIALGEEPKIEHIPLLKDVKISNILDLRKKDEISPQDQDPMKESFEYLNISLQDRKPIGLDTVIHAVEFIEEKLKRGKIYIHCQRGISRSPTILMCYFVSRGYSGESAHNMIKSKRKRIWINHALLPSIFKFERHVASNYHSSKKVDYSAYEKIIGQGYRKLGKFVSYTLTHNKGRCKVPMDDDGFVNIDDMVRMLKTRYEYRKWVKRENLYELIDRFGKDRFVIKNEKIKAI